MQTTNTESVGAGDSFTPGELAYFKSGGQDTTALESEIAANGSGEAGGVDKADPSSGEGGTDNGSQRAAAGQEKGSDEGADTEGAEGEEVVIVGKDGKPRSQNGRFVPHAALHKEREKHKLTRSELETAREKMARADERLAVLNEILKQAEPGEQKVAPQEETKIDPSADPLGALNQALTKIKSLEAEMGASKNQSQERENARAMQAAYQNDAVRYLSEKPEFKDAYTFLIQGRHRELEAMGMADATERNRFIANEERQIVAQAFQSRRSPSQMLHNLAVARGFQPKAAETETPKTDPVKKIEAIANGQRQAGASLSNAGGSSGEGLTAAALADMSEEEFASVAAKLGKSKLRQLLGG